MRLNSLVTSNNDPESSSQLQRTRIFGPVSRIPRDLNHINNVSRRERPLRIQMTSFSEND